MPRLAIPSCRRPIAALLALSLLPGPLAAAGGGAVRDLADLSLEELLDVEVTSVARRGQKLSEAAAAVFVITAEDIRRSGATSIPELLRMVPGVEVAAIDGNKWAVSARGFNSRFANKMLVMIDGRSIYTPLFSGVYWDVQDTLLADIERIEVIRGPGATLWGANAVNGVINILTRGAADTRGGLVTAIAGTEETQAAARWGGAAGERASYRVWAKAFERGPQELSDGGEASDDWRMGRGGFRVDWQRSKDDAVTVQGDAYAGSAGTRQSSVISFAPPFRTVHDIEDDVSGANLLARWTRRYSERSDATLQAYWDRTDRDTPIYGERRDTFDLDFQHRWLRGAHELVWGLGWRISDDSFDGTFFAAMDPDDRTDDVWSAFVQDELSLAGGRLRVTLGTKLEHNDYTGFEVQPSGRVLVRLGDDASLWGAVSRAVRTPSRAESDARIRLDMLATPPFGATAIELQGSPGYESEELLAWELGFRADLAPRLGLDVALFYNDYDRLRSTGLGQPRVVFSPVPHVVQPLLFGNDTRGRIAGGEVLAQWSPVERWRLTSGYSYLDAALEVPTSGLELATAADSDQPRHQLKASSLVTLPHDLELDVWLYAVGELPLFGVDGYTRLDARLGWKARPGLFLDLVLQNLLDDRHPEFGSTLGEQPTSIQRSLHGRLLWRF